MIDEMLRLQYLLGLQSVVIYYQILKYKACLRKPILGFGVGPKELNCLKMRLESPKLVFATGIESVTKGQWDVKKLHVPVTAAIIRFNHNLCYTA